MTVYYHGGKPGLRRGDIILPPNETGALSTSDYAPSSLVIHERDHVYFTSDLAGAIAYAAAYPNGTFGHVYEVEPIGPVEPDPDVILPGFSWMAPRARVMRRIRVKRKTMLQVFRHFRSKGPRLVPTSLKELSAANAANRKRASTEARER